MALRVNKSNKSLQVYDYRNYIVKNTTNNNVQIGKVTLQPNQQKTFDLNFRQVRSLRGYLSVELTNAEDNIYYGANVRDITNPISILRSHPDGFLISDTRDTEFSIPASIFLPTRGSIGILDENYNQTVYRFSSNNVVLPVKVRKVFNSKTTVKNIVAFGVPAPYNAKLVSSNTSLIEPGTYDVRKTLIIAGII